MSTSGRQRKALPILRALRDDGTADVRRIS